MAWVIERLIGLAQAFNEMRYGMSCLLRLRTVSDQSHPANGLYG